MARKQYTTLEYLLLAMIPYTKPNGDLAISASRFFYELEKTSKTSRSSFRSTFYRAKKQGYVNKINGQLVLEKKGRDKVKPYLAKKLPKDVVLMVMFDIPEEFRYKRTQLRTLLKLRDFRQVQKSVWATKMDHTKEVKEFVKSLDLGDCIQIFEAAKV